jgi:hypothetical protein
MSKVSLSSMLVCLDTYTRTCHRGSIDSLRLAQQCKNEELLAELPFRLHDGNTGQPNLGYRTLND